MRAALLSVVSASVSFFVPGVDLRPALTQPAGQSAQQALLPALLQPASLQPASLQPALQPASLQPALQLPQSIGLEPRVTALPTVGIAENAFDHLRWFSYGLFAALFTMAFRSRLQPSVASLATAGQRRADAVAPRVLRAARRASAQRRSAVARMLEAPEALEAWRSAAASGASAPIAEAQGAAAAVAEPPSSARQALDAWKADAARGVIRPVAVQKSVAEKPKPPANVAAASPTVEEPPSEISRQRQALDAWKLEAAQGVIRPVAVAAKPKPQSKPTREAWQEGLFAPLVLGAKQVMGEQKLKEVRAAVIAKHSKVIANFVDTSESEFGQLVLQRMFEYADKDGNGTLDKEEVRSALLDLGFDFLDEKQVAKLIQNADADKNDVIDFEEFVKATPKALRTNLTKLAKKNGHDLGFLV